MVMSYVLGSPFTCTTPTPSVHFHLFRCPSHPCSLYFRPFTEISSSRTLQPSSSVSSVAPSPLPYPSKQPSPPQILYTLDTGSIVY